MKIIEKKSVVTLSPATGSILDTTNITDKTTNTYSARVVDEKIAENSGVQIYSTTETKAGIWIDGKPLYRKIIETTAPKTTANGTYITGKTEIADNIDMAVIEYVFAIESNGATVSMPYVTNAGYQLKSNIGVEKNLYVINGVTTYNNLPVKASVLYTKTTD